MMSRGVKHALLTVYGQKKVMMDLRTQEDSSSRATLRMMGLAWSCLSSRKATMPSAMCLTTCGHILSILVHLSLFCRKLL